MSINKVILRKKLELWLEEFIDNETGKNNNLFDVSVMVLFNQKKLKRYTSTVKINPDSITVENPKVKREYDRDRTYLQMEQSSSDYIDVWLYLDGSYNSIDYIRKVEDLPKIIVKITEVFTSKEVAIPTFSGEVEILSGAGSDYVDNCDIPF